MPVAEQQIPAPDGTPLAATLYLPQGDGPWPALLEALPYRKDDITASYRPEYVRFAEAGYVVCRVDVRGTGSSGGIAADEYPASERTDLLAVIAWLASQPWSSGAVGMFGTSYSGFNALQLAAERPPQLKAIVSIFASDDRYADDVHLMGGVQKAVDTVDYPNYMVALNALPPVPSVFGDGWREEWERRVRETEPWIFTWLEHQDDDAYWRSGSVRDDPTAIEAATMLVGGWADGYTNACLRSFEAFRCPTRVLIGPWPHASVETCVPGPTIDLVAEMLRWWDRWLKDIDTGIDDEPPIALYQQRSTRPDPLRLQTRGEWRYEPTWPPDRLRPRAFALQDAVPGGLAWGAGPQDSLAVRGDVGTTAWISCAGTMPWGLSSDQGPDEALSLSYTWAPLAEELAVTGYPRLRVRLRADRPVATLSAKVVDVFPDGAASFVVRGVANLARPDPWSGREPIERDVWTEVTVELEAVAWTFEEGHRIRLDIAGADWPNVWSPPEPVTLAIDRRATELELPVMDGPSPAGTVPAPPPSTRPQADPRANGPDGWSEWRIVHDVVADATTATARYGGESHASEQAPAIRSTYGGTVGVSIRDPGVAWSEASSDHEIVYPEATCRAAATSTIRSDATTFAVTIELVVSEDGTERWRRTWERVFPRDRG
jgi:hypothetical protein